jgi:hypothetical protein
MRWSSMGKSQQIEKKKKENEKKINDQMRNKN